MELPLKTRQLLSRFDGQCRWVLVRSLPRQNLERVLEMQLPSRDGGAVEDVSADCCICYAYRLPSASNAAGSAPALQQYVGKLGSMCLPSVRTASKFENRHLNCLRAVVAGDEVPDVNCSNPHCGRPFHRSCLISWLRAVTDTRQSFNTLFGQCPYCTAPISVVDSSS